MGGRRCNRRLRGGVVLAKVLAHLSDLAVRAYWLEPAEPVCWSGLAESACWWDLAQWEYP